MLYNIKASERGSELSDLGRVDMPTFIAALHTHTHTRVPPCCLAIHIEWHRATSWHDESHQTNINVMCT